MSDDILLTSIEDSVFTITLNRPKANAFNDDLISLLKKALKEAEKNDEVRVIVLSATGKLFSAGQDVSSLNDNGEPRPFRKHLLKTYNPLIMQIRKLEKPVLALINGAVAGAALGIVLACDLRIASDNARFIVGFSGIGLAPDSAVSLMLPTLIGLGRATEAIFFNQPIAADQAFQWGLVNEVVEPDKLIQSGKEWSTKLAAGPTYAMGLTKRDLNKSIIPNLEAVLDYEAHVQEIAGHGLDHKEGLSAFLEKRPANFKGK